MGRKDKTTNEKMDRKAKTSKFSHGKIFFFFITEGVPAFWARIIPTGPRGAGVNPL